MKSKGNVEIYGSKNATREVFSLGLLEDGEVWMEMIKSRNLTYHTYNEETTQQIIEAIKNYYHATFIELQNKLDGFVA